MTLKIHNIDKEQKILFLCLTLYQVLSTALSNLNKSIQSVNN